MPRQDEDDLHIARRLGQAELIRTLLLWRWPRVEVTDVERLSRAPVEQLLVWAKRLVAEWPPEDIFREDRARERIEAVVRTRFPDLPDYRWAMLRSAEWDRLARWVEFLDDADSDDRIFARTAGDQLFDQGFEEGYGTGRLQGLIESLVERRFGEVPPGVIERLEEAEMSELEAWATALLHGIDKDEWLALLGL